MDNFHIDVTAAGRAAFDTAMGLAMYSHSKAVAYALHPKLGLVLFWSDHEKEIADRTEMPSFSPHVNRELWDQLYKESCAKVVRVPVQKLPYPMQGKALVEFAWNWLETAERGEQPDHDGENEAGWRVYCEGWGRVGDAQYSFVAIQPVWAMYGK
jgi:hypothetical protein